MGVCRSGDSHSMAAAGRRETGQGTQKFDLSLQGQASSCWRLTVTVLEARRLRRADLCE